MNYDELEILKVVDGDWWMSDFLSPPFDPHGELFPLKQQQPNAEECALQVQDHQYPQVTGAP